MMYSEVSDHQSSPEAPPRHRRCRPPALPPLPRLPPSHGPPLPPWPAPRPPQASAPPGRGPGRGASCTRAPPKLLPSSPSRSLRNLFALLGRGAAVVAARRVFVDAEAPREAAPGRGGSDLRVEAVVRQQRRWRLTVRGSACADQCCSRTVGKALREGACQGKSRPDLGRGVLRPGSCDTCRLAPHALQAAQEPGAEAARAGPRGLRGRQCGEA